MKSTNPIFVAVGERGLRIRRLKSAITIYWMAERRGQKCEGFSPSIYRLYSGPADPPLAEIERMRREAKGLNEYLDEWVIARKHRPPSALRVGYVYFLRDGECVKIGFSQRLDRRMKELSTGSAGDQKLIGAVRAPASFERYLHRTFRRLRVRLEWFREVDELKVMTQMVARGATAEQIAPVWRKASERIVRTTSERLLPKLLKIKDV